MAPVSFGVYVYMQYHSTRHAYPIVNAREALRQGLSPDGGLYVSDALGTATIEPSSLVGQTYYQLAERVLGILLDDFTPEEIHTAVERAYRGKFRHEAVTPVTVMGEDWLLELFHGPTSAFKDVALCLLPQLMSTALKGTGKRVMIATATSGDTGKAALSGFQDVPGIGIAVFYPEGKVSEIQRLQMVTQAGNNVAVSAVKGNFDDVQSAVKTLFKTEDVASWGIDGLSLSSANSINIGRLVPQIVYYFDAYRQLMEKGAIKAGETVDFAVPTGNFGDVLAGYYAKRMGLPVRKLIVASNANHVLADFFETGVYDRRRDFVKTISPSMDILISSNLERLLYEVSGGNTELVGQWMSSLEHEGYYRVPDDVMAKIRDTFAFGWTDDEGTRATIRKVWEKEHRLIDPHTAVAVKVARKWRTTLGTDVPLVVLSTASPYKFCRDVAGAIGLPISDEVGDFMAMAMLSEATQTVPPAPLAQLASAPVRHQSVVAVSEMASFVKGAAQRVFSHEETHPRTITVSVPATTANIGPGYDCLGMALTLRSRFTFTRSDVLSFEGCESAFANETNLVWQGFVKVFEKAGLTPPAMHIAIDAQVPVARGLGSSSTCLVAGVVAANDYLNQRFTDDELFAVLNDLEGHPDNVAAALFGGLTASFVKDNHPVCVPFKPHASWRFVTVIPNYEVSTHEARKILKREVSLTDTVFSLSHAIAMVKALEAGDAILLREACEDRLHEPYRATLIPEFGAIKTLALEKGADAFFISGSGSTLMAVTHNEDQAQALAQQLQAAYPAFAVKVLEATQDGALVS